MPVGGLGDDGTAAAESTDALVSSSGRRVPVVRILPWVVGDATSSVGAAIDAVAAAELEAPEPSDSGDTPTDAGVRVASAFTRAA